MRIGSGGARSCAAFVLRHVRSYWSYSGELIGLVKGIIGDIGSRCIGIGRRCVGGLVTRVRGVKSSARSKEGSEEWKGTELGAVSEKTRGVVG